MPRIDTLIAIDGGVLDLWSPESTITLLGSNQWLKEYTGAAQLDADHARRNRGARNGDVAKPLRPAGCPAGHRDRARDRCALSQQMWSRGRLALLVISRGVDHGARLGQPAVSVEAGPSLGQSGEPLDPNRCVHRRGCALVCRRVGRHEPHAQAAQECVAGADQPGGALHLAK